MPRPAQKKESEFRKRFGARLRELRKERDLTQDQLAERVDISRESIKNIEKGKHGPLFETLENLINGLDCEPFELFEFEMPRKKRQKPAGKGY